VRSDTPPEVVESAAPAPAPELPALPVLMTAGPSERAETDLLARHGNQALLASYGTFRPDRSPVVLVHGMRGSGPELKALAERLEAAGRQVLFALYDDVGTETHENARQLAAALRDLRARFGDEMPLDIVAHSMGGIVARGALNYLEKPDWLGPSDAVSEPCAGFGPVRLRTVDTPWHGYRREEPSGVFGWVTGLKNALKTAIQMMGARGFLDMRASSAMFEKLYEPRLTGVDIVNHAARGALDAVLSVPELPANVALELAKHIAGGPEPTALPLRNLARALASDARYEALRTAVESAVTRGELGEGEMARSALTRLYEAAMPRFDGTHASVLEDRPGDGDLVDVITAELRR
jgi:pimeloyl-ACP methyl ester carboxylesterase